MDYRQVHEWIQKCLGKDIPPNLPNRLNLEEKQGAQCRILRAPVLTLAESSTSTAGETGPGEINHRSDLFLMYLNIN